MNRLSAAIVEFFHAFVDLFVRPLKILFPQEYEWWRPDNRPPYVVRDIRPLGYWLGHILAYLIVIAVVIWLLETGEPPPVFVDE